MKRLFVTAALAPLALAAAAHAETKITAATTAPLHTSTAANGVSNAAGSSVDGDYTPADSDKDGDPDGPIAQGSGRFGIRATGPAAFTGDIRNETGVSITVEGDDSAGVSIETQLTGSLVNAGTI